MREYRVIAALTLLLFLAVAGYFIRHSVAPGAGAFDELAYAQISAACANKAECKVNLRDLYDGDWDTFWEFGDGTSQAELRAAVPGVSWRPSGFQRLVVLTQGGQVRETLTEEANPEIPEDHKIIFTDSRGDEQASVRLPRDTWLWARLRTSLHGTYYVLSPDDR